MAFLESIIAARVAAADDPGALSECCARLQEQNSKLKALVATSDADAAHEAMCGGLTGIGCNDAALIASLCSRTKAQLARTAAAYREQFDKGLRDTVREEAGGNYGHMLQARSAALEPPSEASAVVVVVVADVLFPLV